MWGGRVTADAAYRILSNPDVTVTNQNDKDTQLAKIKVLDNEAKEAFDAASAAEQLAAGVPAVELAIAGFEAAVLAAAGANAGEAALGRTLRAKDLGEFSSLCDATAIDWSKKDLTTAHVSVPMLEALLRCAPHLVGLNLDGFELHMPQLRGTQAVQSIDLSDKKLGPLSGMAIAVALCVNASLTKIS
jgi:hypothetical protein